MKRMFAILTHPVDYFNLVRLREWVVMLQASTMMLKIDEPSVWDVDRIHQNINAMYGVIHEDPNVLKESKLLCKHLFWTLLLSRFKQLEISRERAKYVLDFYEYMKSSFKDKNELFELVVFLNAAVDMFGKI
jgi:hypothetical protein